MFPKVLARMEAMKCFKADLHLSHMVFTHNPKVTLGLYGLNLSFTGWEMLISGVLVWLNNLQISKCTWVSSRSRTKCKYKPINTQKYRIVWNARGFTLLEASKQACQFHGC